MEEKRIRMIADIYRGICGRLPELAAGAELEDRVKELLSAGQEHFDTVDYYEVFWLANESSFLQGSRRGWKADFLWLIKPENMIKVLTEQYTPYSLPLERKLRRDTLRLCSEIEEEQAGLCCSGRGGRWVHTVSQAWMDQR